MVSKIRFHYLYRDSSNYKKFGHKDFPNPTNLSLEEIQTKLERFLIDGMYFYPKKVGIKKFLFHRFIDDDSWYEFEILELINGRDEQKESIKEFINRLK